MDVRTDRLASYQHLKAGMIDHMEATERGLRKIKGLSSGKLDKLLKSVHDRHKKLLRRLDQEIAYEETLAGWSAGR